MHSAGDVRTQWLPQLFCTDPADRAGAEAAVRGLYEEAGLAPPRHACWFDSPFDAAWAVALLIEEHHRVWRDLIGAARNRRSERDRMDRVAATLYAQCGVASLAAARETMGPPLGMALQSSGASTGLQPAILSARMGMHDDVSALFVAPTETDDLYRAESRFWGGNLGALISGVLCPTAGTLIGQSFFADYSFWTMAEDETDTGGDAPAILRAAWTAARRAGPWWPFANGAILTERPAEIHKNNRWLLHREDGPAVVYRDGAHVFAWSGLAVPEAWIMAPETLPAATFKGFDPTFREWVKRRSPKPGPRVSGRRSAAGIIDAELPSDSDERLRVLRTHAGGALPLFDRYAAGDHDAVWSELVALGDAVRRDPHAADALAVAYETMRRVDLNVRTLVERLHAVGYRFGPPVGAAGRVISLFRRDRREQEKAHVPPAPGARATRVRIEKRIGPLPLSIRAFFELVGSVDLTGRHPALTPGIGAVAEDPLVVHGVADAWEQVDGAEEEELDEIIIAPDDLHKAGTSGGDPYAIAVPDPRADGELLNERHGLLFVPYLRLCFGFGGFPGYEGQIDRPAEIDELARALLAF
jgi:hypothetical protein